MPVELWFHTEFRGQVLWFRTARHGDALLAWLEGNRDVLDLPWQERIWLETLPRWMTDPQNQAPLTALVRRLLEDARSPTTGG